MRTLKRLWLVLTTRFHFHTCPCGEPVICQNRYWCSDVRCEACSTVQMIDWINDEQARQQARRRARV